MPPEGFHQKKKKKKKTLNPQLLDSRFPLLILTRSMSQSRWASCPLRAENMTGPMVLSYRYPPVSFRTNRLLGTRTGSPMHSPCYVTYCSEPTKLMGKIYVSGGRLLILRYAQTSPSSRGLRHTIPSDWDILTVRSATIFLGIASGVPIADSDRDINMHPFVHPIYRS